jgi:pSer/pThr/pTyr-binding forkhead associated (FHA) protein
MPPDPHVNPAEEPSAAGIGIQPPVTPTGRYSIIDLGSHDGTYVNGTRVNQQELNEGDIIAIGHATFLLAGGELIEYAGDGELLAGMVVTRLERLGIRPEPEA